MAVLGLSRVRLVLLACALLSFPPAPVHADAIAPNIFVVWPAAWVLLLAIVPLEAAMAVRILRIDLKLALRMSAKANAVSTLIGIPANWLLIFLLLFVIIGTSEGPAVAIGRATFMSSGKSAGYSGVLWATTIFFVPLFLLSVFWEYRIARRSFDKDRWPEVRRWAWLANAASYGAILAVLVYEALRALRAGGEFWI